MQTKITIIVFAVICLVECASDIIVLNKQNFSQAKKQFEQLFVYFFDENCSQCTSTNQLFYTLSSLNMAGNSNSHQKQTRNNRQQIQNNAFKISDKVQFSQIKFEGNQDIFKQQNVDAVPQFRIYKQGDKKVFRYPNIDLNDEKLWMLALWIKRVTSQFFPAFQTLSAIDESQFQSTKNLIVDCKYKQFINSLAQSQTYLSNLGINFICAQNSGLKNGQILLKNKKFTQKLSQCKLDEQQKWQECNNKIINFQFKGLVHWNDQLINHLYNNNRSLFVLITSNQSVSRQYVRNITKIKQKLQENKIEILPIFAIADVHYDVQQTIRMKKFIGGYENKGWPYPYPILAFLKMNEKGDICKYIYQQKYKNSRKTSLTLEEWVSKAIKGQLIRDFRGMNASKEMQMLLNTSDRSVYKIFASELSELISRQKSNKNQNNVMPVFYLYVYWRTDWNMQLISSRTKRWWEDTKYNLSLYNFDLYDNELPEQIKVQTLPALINFYSDGSHQVHEGIQDQVQLKRFIKESIKKSSNN